MVRINERVCFVCRKQSLAAIMKRERDDADAEASSDDEMGPMPVSEAQVVKKKRKGEAILSQYSKY